MPVYPSCKIFRNLFHRTSGAMKQIYENIKLSKQYYEIGAKNLCDTEKS